MNGNAGKPDAGKLARPVWGALGRNLHSKGCKALSFDSIKKRRLDKPAPQLTC